MDNLKNYLVTLNEDTDAVEAIGFACQAEDPEHAKEQALNAYPQGSVIGAFRQWAAGDTVWWNDPDGDVSSGLYRVVEVLTETGQIDSEDTIIVLKNTFGSIAEVLPQELEEPRNIEKLVQALENSASPKDEAMSLVGRCELEAFLSMDGIKDVCRKANALQPTQHALSQAMNYADDLERRNAEAARFVRELTDSCETLSGLADQYGVRTLSDLLYLQHAILVNGHIDRLDDSQILDVVDSLPSAKRWREFIRDVYRSRT